MKVEMILSLTKSTKNTHVYGTDEEVAVKTVYIQKSEMPVATPTIKLTIETL